GPLPALAAAVASERGMVRLSSVRAMREWSRRQRRQGRCLAVVPTMGALHRGHEALVRQAAGLADDVVVSIYVNPAQFGPGEDLERYPRSIQEDLQCLAGLDVAAAFVPEAPGLYAPDHSTWVQEDALSAVLEGAWRPGHFRGVLTVVLKLFHIIEPHKAVFGLKDGQQALLIRRMVRDLHLPVEIHLAPTVREADGLALSSRNAYLDPDERRRAPVLYRAIRDGLARLEAGETDPEAVLRPGLERIRKTAGVALDYLDVVDLGTLRRPQQVRDPVLLAGAVRVGSTRLIDCAAHPAGGGLISGQAGGERP
ncbi:MAG: pantoate--beta-alanine ligase, partial [Acidobacteriota bacterium]